MKQHTPGPWRIEGLRVVTAGRLEFLQATRKHHAGTEQEEWIANLSLISAAPDLLAALKRLVAVSEVPECFEGYKEEAHAAIAKAEGKVS